MNTIDHLSFTKTTAEVIDWYSKTGLDIHEDMKTCSRGNREAIEDVIGKRHKDNMYGIPERPYDENKDIVGDFER